MDNQENTLKKDVAENWIRAAAFETLTKTAEKLSVKMTSGWMRASKEVIMIFVAITNRTVRTLFGVLMMNNVTNWQQAMRPFDEEVWATRFLIAQGVIELPIDVTGEGPVTRAKNILAHGKIKDQVTNLTAKPTSDRIARAARLQ